jgi:hypothetical protein
VVTLSIGRGTFPTPERPAPDQAYATPVEFALRLFAAALQILATVAVVHALSPTVAGVYFKGFVIAYALAALARGKYELYVFQYFLSQPHTSIAPRDLVRALGIRVLIRGALASAFLLVFTTDLDVMEPHLRPFLETYLPFVLAVPFATLALFLASVLRAINRTLSGVLVSSYGINVMILAAAGIASSEHEGALFFLSWAYLAGTLLACGTGVLITRRIFEPAASPSDVSRDNEAWREIYMTAGHNGLTGITLACLQWGPLCVLAVFGSDVQLAEFAVATRTTQIVDFLLPAAVLVPRATLLHSRLASAMRSPVSKLVIDLSVSLVTTTLCVLAVAILTPWLVSWYGPAYSGLAGLFALLFATQWLNGSGRPAIRHLAAHWDRRQIRRILWVSMVPAIAVSLFGINYDGALAAAVGVFAGALLLNGQAIFAAFTCCNDTSNRAG